MKLYYHTDRSDALHPGFIVEREPYHDESLLAVFSPFIDNDFLNHLSAMAKEGLSLHGARYLIQLNGSVDFPCLSIELYYEYIRWKYYPDRPSRMQSFFAWQKYDDAIDAAKEIGTGRVFEVRCDSVPFVGDMNHLKLSLDPEKQQRAARGYWEGNPFSRDFGYKPRWEYVLRLQVEIVREVLVNPITRRP